jgi:hypothetical protein
MRPAGGVRGATSFTEIYARVTNLYVPRAADPFSFLNQNLCGKILNRFVAGGN